MKFLFQFLALCCLTAFAVAQPVLYFDQPVATTNAFSFTTVGMAIYTGNYRPAVVEQLGMFDNFGEIQEPHTVGLWRIDLVFAPLPDPFPVFSYRASLVATSQFLPGDDAFQAGGYRFHSLPPIQLERNQRYVVATHYSLNTTAPVAQAPPHISSFLPAEIFSAQSTVSINDRFAWPSHTLETGPGNFSTANLIFSTNRPPSVQFALHHQPHPIGEAGYPWIVSTNDQPVAVILDARQTSDPDSAVLQYQWRVNEAGVTFSESVLLTNLFPLDQMFGVTLRISDEVQYVESFQPFRTFSPRSAIDAMKEFVRASGASKSLKAALLRSLRNPATAFRRNRPDRALTLLQKFEQRIQERLMPVDAYHAHSLLDASEAIREAFQPDDSLQ